MNPTTVTELGPQPNSCEGSARATSHCPAPGYVPIQDNHPVCGRELRYVLTNYISHGYRTVNELVNKLAHDGYTVWGRASKVISDALRWEIRNRRVRRIRRGIYAIDTIPRTTMHRITTRSHTLFFAPHVVALRQTIRSTRTPQPPPPPDRHWRKWQKTQSTRPTATVLQC